MINKKKVFKKKINCDNLRRLFVLHNVYNLDDNKLDKKHKLNKHFAIISSRKWKRRRIEKEITRIMEED